MSPRVRGWGGTPATAKPKSSHSSRPVSSPPRPGRFPRGGPQPIPTTRHSGGTVPTAAPTTAPSSAGAAAGWLGGAGPGLGNRDTWPGLAKSHGSQISLPHTGTGASPPPFTQRGCHHGQPGISELWPWPTLHGRRWQDPRCARGLSSWLHLHRPPPSLQRGGVEALPERKQSRTACCLMCCCLVSTRGKSWWLGHPSLLACKVSFTLSFSGAYLQVAKAHYTSQNFQFPLDSILRAKMSPVGVTTIFIGRSSGLRKSTACATNPCWAQNSIHSAICRRKGTSTTTVWFA